MGSWHWWFGNIFVGILSAFFLLFGAGTLAGAYQLLNPHEFIMTFFSSSMMILLSLVGILYPCLRIHAYLRERKTKE